MSEDNTPNPGWDLDRASETIIDILLVDQLVQAMQLRELPPDAERDAAIAHLQQLRNLFAHGAAGQLRLADFEPYRDEISTAMTAVLAHLTRIQRSSLGTRRAQDWRRQARPEEISDILNRAANQRSARPRVPSDDVEVVAGQADERSRSATRRRAQPLDGGEGDAFTEVVPAPAASLPGDTSPALPDVDRVSPRPLVQPKNRPPVADPSGAGRLVSSGQATILPVGVVIAAGDEVILAATAAAVLVAYAANQAAEGALRAVGRRSAAPEAWRWQAAAADVVGVNARLRLATHQARQAGAPVDLPPPLDLAGVSRDDAIRWAEQTQQRLRVAQEALDAAVAESRGRHLMAALPPSVSGLPDAAATFAAYRDLLRKRRAGDVKPRPVDVDAEVAAMLHRLDPDATPAEQTRVLQAAALTRAQNDYHDADAYLSSLRRLVHDVNVRVADRRLAAQWMQALEVPSVAAVISNADPPSPFQGTAARLLAVAEGRAELTAHLRTEAAAAAEWAFGVTRMQFLRERIRSSLAEAGYQVGEEFSTGHTLRFAASRSDWHGEHSALIWVDAKDTLTGRLVREYESSGDEAAARDRSRCDDLQAVLQSLPTDGGGGMAVQTLHRNHPGPGRSSVEDDRLTITPTPSGQ